MNSATNPTGSVNVEALIKSAQLHVCTAMTGCLALWFVPLVSGVACSTAEAFLIDRILKIMGCYSSESSDKIQWFYRKKTFFLFGSTYIPVAGVPLQLFETYGLGQFAIHCSLQPHLLTNDLWLEQSWQEIAPEIFSGSHAIAFFEQFSGKEFPNHARGTFINAVDLINACYLFSQRVPGFGKAQELLGEGVRRLTCLSKQAGGSLLKKGKKTGVNAIRRAREIKTNDLKKVNDPHATQPLA